MPAKKKIVKKKISKPKTGQVIKQSVTVHLGSKTKKVGGGSGKAKKKVVGTPPEYRQSSGYILPGAPTIQVNPSYQPQFQKIEDRQLLIEDLKRQFPLLTYTPQQPSITQYGEEPSTPIIRETETEYSFMPEPPTNISVGREGELPPSSVVLSPPKQKNPSQRKSEEEKIAQSREKLNNLGFPERIAVSGANRSSDIDAVVQMMINANRAGGNVKAIDLFRVYGIDGTTTSRREEKLTGIQKERRPKKSQIPTLEEYNLR